jgi:hypothetical protein
MISYRVGNQIKNILKEKTCIINKINRSIQTLTKPIFLIVKIPIGNDYDFFCAVFDFVLYTYHCSTVQNFRH